jgi:hypothetical protein
MMMKRLRAVASVRYCGVPPIYVPFYQLIIAICSQKKSGLATVAEICETEATAGTRQPIYTFAHLNSLLPQPPAKYHFKDQVIGLLGQRVPCSEIEFPVRGEIEVYGREKKVLLLWKRIEAAQVS